MISRLDFERQRLLLDERLLAKGYVRTRTSLGWTYTKPDEPSDDAVSEIVRRLAGEPVEEEQL